MTEAKAIRLFVEGLEVYREKKTPASRYLKQHNYTSKDIIFRTHHGDWYEHPIYGEEAALLLVHKSTDKIFETFARDYSDTEEV